MARRARPGSWRGATARSIALTMVAVLFAGLGAMNVLAGGKSAKMADLETQLGQLEWYAAFVEDASAIRRLQRAYGYYADQRLWDEMAELFAPDATIEIGLDGVYVGQKRIREYLYQLGGGKKGLQPGQLNDHLELQPVITLSVDGRTAKGRWRNVIMTGQLGESAAWGEGTYENEYVKHNGVWKISKLHWYQTYLVPYAGGWAKNKDLTNGVFVSKQFPPDRPPTQTYPIWPGVNIPPFHYRNPVKSTRPTPFADATLDSDATVAALQKAVGQLQRRVGLLLDIDDIENLVSMYGYYLDKQQWDLFTDLFAEDSSMEISQRGVYVGKKGVRRALELFGPQNIEPEHLHNHIQMQPVINVSPDGQHAWVRSRALSQLGTFNRIGAWGDSVYENEMVKENGVWKYKKDHLYTTFFASYDKGWAFGATPAPKRSEKIPPDLPPTEKWEALPEVYVPPYHYKNPVTGGETKAAPELVLEHVPTALRAKLVQAAKRVTKLEDERAIENLQRSYGYYVDKAKWQDAADLFADDGTLEIGGRGVFVGKARVLQYLTWLAPEGLTRGKLFNHIQLQPVVHVSDDGKSAKGRWRFIAEVGEDQKQARWGAGVYENDYVKENGVWKIKSLHAYFRFDTPYEDGWGKTALPNTRPEKDLPPDRPPTVVYDSYPSTFVAPFHYKSP